LPNPNIIKPSIKLLGFFVGGNTMAIDIGTEALITINEAAKALPSRPHIAPVWRWVYHGCRGVKLETVSIGGRRMTSQEAIARFIERSTAVANGDAIPTRTAKQRQRAIETAERELAAAGI
jgi:hypothetical protein